MTEHAPLPLPASAVRFRADFAEWGIASSDDLEPATSLVGQQGALTAIGTGLSMDFAGYNVFLAGTKGTGRFVGVRQAIRDAGLRCTHSVAHTFVHDFTTPERPILITLPRGMGREFQHAVDQLRTALGDDVPALLGSEVIAKSRKRLLDKYERLTTTMFDEFEKRVEAAGFMVMKTETAGGAIRIADVYPIVQGEPTPLEQIEADPGDAGFDTEGLQALRDARTAFKNELDQLVTKHRALSVKYMKLVHDSEQRHVSEGIAPLFLELDGFAKHDQNVTRWHKGMKEELLDNLDMFREHSAEQGAAPQGPSMEAFLWFVRSNLMWDSASSSGDSGLCPIVEEAWPSWRNLFGTVESAGDPPLPTFFDLRPGSLLRADGGFLVISARDILAEPRVYENLKRVLRKNELELAPQQEGQNPQSALKPAPIPVKVKVVLVGERHTYDVLHAMDPDFPMIFKIKAEFDEDMPRTESNVRGFLAALRRIIDQEKLPAFDRGALETLLEESVRLAGHQEYFTTRFSELADLMREAAHLASKRGAERVEGEDQRAAIDLRAGRHDFVERRMLDMFRDGKVLLDVSGYQIGQVNGLGYYDLDDTQFGIPARISATSATGRRGVVNIEREAELSGSIHDKGVLLLSGYLAKAFAQDKPLSLQANIAFEQSYATVDGDSASLAELLALLSSLSEIPLRQDVAVTGSLNQRGQVQPVGGVTEKTQGFFRASRILGAKDTQGVLLPAANVADLQLDSKTCDAIEAGTFHIWPATDVPGALELMTGRPADEVLAACDAKLKTYADIVKNYS
ncbi:MAG: hypothetical protein CMJ83_12710 [Planctomycetes bacterium]|nr:hypothetical protein [Planctomycetota bacterium]